MDLTTGRWPLLAPRDAEARVVRAAMARAVRRGLAPYWMPGHEWLSDREVADLVEFTLSLGEQGEATRR